MQIENSISRVTVRHHSASLVKLNSYPRDGIFSQHLTTMNDSYITTLASYDRHGSDWVVSPQCNNWKVIHFSLIIWVYKVCFWILIKFYLITFQTVKPICSRSGTVNWEGHVSSVVVYWFSSNMRVAKSGQILEGYL